MSARVLAGAVALAAALILCAGPATAQQQEECPASGNPTAGKRVKCVKTTSGDLAIDLTNFDITTSDNHAVYGNHQNTGDIDIDVTGGVISTAAPNAGNIHGVWARHQGNGDYDITVDGAASITLTSTTNEGYGVYGLTKRDGKILVEGSASITTNSDDSHGIYGYHYIGSGPGFKADGKIDIDVAGSASITTKGDEADGIYAFQYDSTQTATIEGDTDIDVAGSASITTEGERSHGISAWHAILSNTGPIYGDIEIDVAGSASINTKKDGSHGIYGLHYGIASATKSANVDLGLDGASIETEGDDAHGIFAWHYNESSNSKGNLEIDVAGGASITTGGADSHGAYGVHTGAGGDIDLDVRGASTSVTTTGADAHGVYAGHRTGEGTIAISIGAGASLTASGAKASGVRIGGFNSTTQALELAAKLGTDGYRQQTVTVNGSVTGGSGDAAGVYLSGGGKVVIGKDASLRAASGAAIRAARKLATETAPALHVSLTLDGRTMAQVFGDDYIMNDGGVTTIVLNGTTLHDEDGNTGNTARNGRWNVSLKSSQSVEGRDFSKTDFIEIETPPAPSKPGVTPGDRSVTLSWTSGGAGGSAITKWQYAYKQSYGYGSWSDICETSQDATCPNRTSHTVTGLINGNTYKFKVRAVNTGGPGVDSPESNAVTPAAPPGTPSWISFYPVTAGDASVNLYWFSPSDGGTGITKFQYAFASKPPGGNYGGYGSWTDACAMASDHDTLPDCRQVFFNAHTVTGLFNGTSYKFKVRAVNAIGGGAASPESIELALTGPPPPPEKPGATAGAGSVALTWISRGDGGHPITKWQYVKKAGDEDFETDWTDICVTATQPDCPERAKHTVTGLAFGTEYRFKVRAVNGEGDGAASPESDAVRPSNPVSTPSAPFITGPGGQPGAVAGDGSATFFWTSGGDGGSSITKWQYVKQAGDEDFETFWTDICVTATEPDCPDRRSHTVTGLTNGVAYRFRVRAVNRLGAGAASGATNAVTPVGAPSAPSITGPGGQPGAVAGDGSATLFWTSGGDGGSPITKWQYVKQAGDGDFETVWTDICVTAMEPDCPDRTSHTVTGLTNGVAYRFRVRAVNALGAGAASEATNAVTPVSTPSAPSITGPGGQPGAVSGDGSATLFWTSGGDGGSPITKWQYVKQAGDEDFETVWTDICVTATEPDCPDRTSHTVTGLTNGVTYRFRVRAVNGLGAGAASGATDALTPAAKPSAPSKPVATAGDGSVALSWTPGSDGGSSITKWQYVKQAGDEDFETVWTDICVTATEPDCPDRTSHTVTGLTNGVTYRFRVRAVNGLGAGAASGATNAVTPVSTPSAPSKPVATAGDGSVALSWTPGSDGGSPITKWQYVKQAGDGDFETVWTDICVTAMEPDCPDRTSHTVTGLTNGVTYRFRVRAVNALGAGAASEATDALTPAAKPSAPSKPVATAGDGSVALSWTPGSDGGSSITKWQYVKQAGDGDFETVWTDICVTAMEPDCPDRTSHTVTGLTNGVTYRFRVRAVNRLGAGAASGATNAVTPVSTPSAPSKPVATAGDGSVALSWTPGSDGGSPITKWQYVKQAGDGDFETVWTDICVTAMEPDCPDRTSHTVTGLTNGVTYRFRVRAVNALGAGAASEATDALTPAAKPSAPSKPVATAGDGSVALSWTPGSDGGSSITKWQYVKQAGGGAFETAWRDVPGSGASTRRHTVASLVNGVAYRFKVRAVNAAGEGAASPASDAVTPVWSPPAMRGWLARFGRAVGSQAVEMISSRMNAPAPGGAKVTLGGRSVDLNADPDRYLAKEGAGFGSASLTHGGTDSRGLARARAANRPANGEEDSPAYREMTMSEFLRGGSFHLASAGEGEAVPGGRWSLWGRGARTSFEGGGAAAIEGDVSTAMLGVDYEKNAVLMGVALSHARGEGGFESGGRSGVEATLTSAHPYLRFALNERVTAWGVLGMGRGEMTLEMDRKDVRQKAEAETDIEMRMAAFGLRGELAKVGGFDLAVKSDVLLAQTDADAKDGLDAVSAEATRLRVMLEASREVSMKDGGAFRPSVEAGLRHDGGDADEGAGVEVGGSLRFTSPALGLTLEFKARGLLTHEEEDAADWGAGGMIRIAPGEAGRGLALTVRPEMGETAGGAARLWGLKDASRLAKEEVRGLDPRVRAEVGYGLDAWGGLLTPYAGLSVSEGGSGIYRLGGRFKVGERLSMSVEGDVRERENDDPAHGVALRGSLRW